MDYSLLLGIHDVLRGELETTERLEREDEENEENEEDDDSGSGLENRGGGEKWVCDNCLMFCVFELMKQNRNCSLFQVLL